MIDVPARRHRDGWLSALGLLLLVVALHHDVVFGGRSLVHSNHLNPFDFRPHPDNYGDGFVPHTEWASRNLWLFANIRDPGAVWWQWEPSTRLLQQAIERREWPFWDPYVAAGTPAMANLIPAFFFPPYTLMVLLGASIGLKNAYFLFLLWGASCLAVLFLRRHGLSAMASFAGGLLVMLSGSMNQNLGSFAGQTAACLPLALYATRALLDAPHPRRAAAVAVIYAAISLASFPPILVGVFGVTVSYALVALLLGDCGTGPADRWRAGGWWLTAAGLALGLVGFYYLPAVALSRAVPQVAALYHGAGLETMPWRNIYQLFSPTLMGGVQVYVDAPFASAGLGAHIPYIGFVCVLAALLARPRSRREATLAIASTLAAALILLKLFGVPPVQRIGALPFFTQIHFSHYLGVPLGFPLIFVAALGIEELVRGRASLWRVVPAAVFAVGGAASLWWMASVNGAFTMPTASYWIRDWRVLMAVAVVATMTVVAASAGRTRTRMRLGAVTVLLAVAVAEATYNNTYPRPVAWDVFEHPVPYVRMLRKEAGLGRIWTFGVPAANDNEAFRLFTLDSLMAFNPPRVYELYRRYGKPAPEVFLRQPQYIPPDRVLDRANVAFVGTYLTYPHIVTDLAARGYERRFDNGFIAQFKRETLPRFFFSSEYSVMTAAQAIEAVAVAPAHEILLEADPQVARTPNASGDPDVQVERYGLNGFALVVDAPRPGLVYAADSYFDGWSASVNGRPTPVLVANYAFRAVVVPVGRSRIEFRYWPPGLTLGLAISALSVLGLGLLVSASSARRTRSASRAATTPA